MNGGRGMSGLQNTIKWFEDAVRETDEIIADCSEDLQAELLERKRHFEVALIALQEKIAEPHQLTLNELRQMDGQPVWCEMQPDYYKCGVVGQKHVGGGKTRTVIGFSCGGEWATYMLRRGKVYDRPPGGAK